MKNKLMNLRSLTILITEELTYLIDDYDRKLNEWEKKWGRSIPSTNSLWRLSYELYKRVLRLRG